MSDADLVDPVALAYSIVEEVVSLFDSARDDGHATITSCVGSKFEGKARAAYDAMNAAGLDH